MSENHIEARQDCCDSIIMMGQMSNVVSSRESASRGSSGNRSRSSSVSRSEVAGQRLYENALKTQQKLEGLRLEASKVQKPVLNLATRGRRSREPSPSPDQTPRYIKLFEHAKAKQATTEVSATEEVVQIIDFSPSRNLGCERLYSLSSSMQQEGKERRIEIMKSKEKPPLPDSHYMKIPASEAAKMYERGMKHLISLEMKRMEAAFETQGNYVSPLVPKSKEEDVVNE